MVFCAAIFVGLCCIIIESMFGVSYGWRLVINQTPICYTMSRVSRWARAAGDG